VEEVEDQVSFSPWSGLHDSLLTRSSLWMSADIEFQCSTPRVGMVVRSD